jgi:aminoglycoside 2'-N-acetyltransferase I
MKVELYAESDVPAGLSSQVRALNEQAWPTEPLSSAGTTPPWTGHDPVLRPLSMLLIEDGTVRSALSILSKEITHAGVLYRVSGLSTVVTDRATRGRGYGVHLVVAAHSAMRASGVDLAIFTCDRPLQGFYERGGWHVLPGSVLVGGTEDAPFASDQFDQFDKVTMVDFFTAIALRNAPCFEHARINLHPGSIDKLW